MLSSLLHRFRRSSARARKAQPTGLRGTLALTFACMAGAVALTLGLLFSDWSAEQTRHDQGTALATLAHSFIEQLDRAMAVRSGELALIAHTVQLLGPQDAAKIQSLLDQLQQQLPAYSWAGLAGADGRVIAATHGLLNRADVSARPWFRAGQAGPAVGDVHEAVLLSHLLTGPTGEPLRFVDVAVPVRDAAGTLEGVLGAHFDWRWAHSVEEAISVPVVGRNIVDLLVVGRDGTVLHGPADLLGTRLSLGMVRQARTNPGEAAVETWPDGHRYLTAVAFGGGYGSYSGLGWTAVARQPLRVVDARVQRVRWTILAAGVVCALLFAAAGWLVASWIAAPIRLMASAAEQLRQGRPVEMPRIARPYELGVLSASINALLGTLTHKQEALDVMAEVARHDPLTGLLNRAGLSAYLDEAMRRARGNGTTVTVLCIDLDGFKAINDTHGHAAGDLLLQEVARRLTACARVEDAVARLGGDEFVLVLQTGASPFCATAALVTERLLSAVAVPCVIEGKSMSVGCSIGAATWPDDADNVEALFQQADDALYAAKRGGRGRAAVHGARLAASVA